MRVIQRKVLDNDRATTIDCSPDATVLGMAHAFSVDTLSSVPCIYVETEDGLRNQQRTYKLQPEDTPLDLTGWAHVGTYVNPQGEAWHLYEDMAART